MKLRRWRAHVNQQLKPGDRAPQMEVLTIDNSKISVELPNRLYSFYLDCPICQPSPHLKLSRNRRKILILF